MNISHISVSTLPVLHRFGGAIERRIVEIAREQARRGHRVGVYSVGDTDDTREVDGVTYHFLKCRTRLPFKHLEFQYRVVRELRKRSDDVLHFHSQPEGAWMSHAVGARKVLSYDFFQFRGGRQTPLYHLYKRALRSYDLLLPCSRYCLEESQSFWSFPTSKLRILHNGVNTRQFRPDPEAAARERAQLGIDKRVMLYVGRVCEQKGSDVLLRAARTLRERRRDVQLVIAGPIGQFGLRDDPDGWVGRIAEVGGLYLGRRRGGTAQCDLQPRRRLRDADPRQRDVRHGGRRGAGVRQAGRLERLGRAEGGGPVELRRARSGRRCVPDGGRGREAAGRRFALRGLLRECAASTPRPTTGPASVTRATTCTGSRAEGRSVA